jgi:hypothetical protein
MAKAPKRIKTPNGFAGRCIVAEHKDIRQCAGNWPMVSDAAGVSPSQIKEAYEASVKAGVPTQFNAEGQAIFHSPRHRREYLRSIGMFDRNAGFSDPTPN